MARRRSTGRAEEARWSRGGAKNGTPKRSGGTRCTQDPPLYLLRFWTAAEAPARQRLDFEEVLAVVDDLRPPPHLLHPLGEGHLPALVQDALADRPRLFLKLLFRRGRVSIDKGEENAALARQDGAPCLRQQSEERAHQFGLASEVRDVSVPRDVLRLPAAGSPVSLGRILDLHPRQDGRSRLPRRLGRLRGH